jgi:hypothetical protein
MIGANNIVFDDDSLKYKERGLNVKAIGYIGEYIYICNNGDITFYNPFTLDQIDKENISVNSGSKTMVFINDTENNIVVLKNKNKFEYKILDKTEKGKRIIYNFKDVQKNVESTKETEDIKKIETPIGTPIGVPKEAETLKEIEVPKEVEAPQEAEDPKETEIPKEGE